jgi:hypothetical protein
MRTFLLTLVFLAGMLSSILAQTDYLQWVVVTLTPKPDRVAQFEAGLAAHNHKYHTADPYKAYVWSVNTGPSAGSYNWIMGPMTFTQMDARVGSDEHDADWNANVLAHCTSLSDIGYWRYDKDLSYQPEGSEVYGKSRLRFHTVKPGEFDRMEEQIKKIAEVYRQKKHKNAYSIYWHYGATNGPNLVVGIDFNKWAALDQPLTFRADYESVHGAGSLQRLINEIEMATDRSKTYDVLTEYMPALSSK